MCILKSSAVSLSVRIEIEIEIEIQVEVELRLEAFDVLADVFIACFLASWPSPLRLGYLDTSWPKNKVREKIKRECLTEFILISASELWAAYEMSSFQWSLLAYTSG